MNDNKMTIIDDEGKEVEVQIILTFKCDENGKQYVLFTAPEDPDTVYPASYTDEGELQMVETEEELAMCEEVLNSFETEV
ncbi:MAG: DUF1292 domain-containing protein [Solobacterium sp.]|jgi:uncharacterized protein YrzB (UPF0473 family)|nr:DUF1292 domain-containing protein [Solobacterium sp.]